MCYRLRQHDPDEYKPGSFRTIQLRPGVKAVIGRPANPGKGGDMKKKAKKTATKKAAAPAKKKTMRAGGLKVTEKQRLTGEKNRVYDADFFGVHVAYVLAPSAAVARKRARAVLRKAIGR